MNLPPPPITSDIVLISRWLEDLYNFLKLPWFPGLWLSASDTWDPGSIADGNEEAKDVTVTGAALGDFAIASFSLDVADLVLDAQVTIANTVTCVLANNTGGAIDLSSGTIYVQVIKRIT